ncbi:DNA-directed RNA polymerase I subunit RPA1 isoform X2 [Euwallacea fornicatus]|uniref:DNA-directed RNA polymerase I subunit RPA1 isoform X2 n=1 Tax=Euwallacea fornicatus TaxID=995702 RepID=UPI00338DC0DA
MSPDPKHVEASSVTFSVLTETNIKNISVLQVVTPLTLDALGHPVVGGLYDIRLGPCTDKSQPCGTCNKNIAQCPGHFGYIDLPVPCENPIFHKVIGTILRYSCLKCHRLQLTQETRNNINMLKEVPDDDLEVVQMKVVKLIIEEAKVGKICIYCKSPMDKIQVFAQRIVMTTRKKGSDERETKYLNASNSKTYLREIWTNEEELMKIIAPVLNHIDTLNPTDAFYYSVIPVAPPNLRPVNFVNGRVVENSQTTLYKNLITNALVINQLIRVVQKKGDVSVLASKEALDFYETAKGKTPIEKLNNCWEDLQNCVNSLLSHDAVRASDGLGLKQIIEKKAGIIRQHMMGKRVNFAARSVITPDPNLDIGEVGIPETFAMKLTCPIAVTPWNVEHMRKLIKNGPDVHPGAVLIEMEDGSIKKINPRNKVLQESFLKSLLTPLDVGTGFRGIKTVHRHLQNGDILLLNRQPTLHKPSIMAHRARILKGEKTLRLHYANCKAYNADFDGDEMNAHCPQDEVARSEGYNIAEVAQQYLVPKDGTPLSGLIQDHMIAGVGLSLRGRFFERMDYHQLVFQALSHRTDRIVLLPPAILKPHQLWSGKQILSTVIINILPKGKKLINMTSSAKISGKAWQKLKERAWKAGGSPFKHPNTMSEAEVIIRQGELLVGILDKTHYGATPYGLIHCVYELYGGQYAVSLLSSFAKLFTRFLQQEGFTLGVHDILILKPADEKRKKIIKKSREIGREAIANALGLPVTTTIDDLVEGIESRCAADPKFRQVIDRSYKSTLDSFTNAINKCCLPAGLICKFPENNLQLMVQSGAKGSTVNTMQISCLLGQIELEGKRPPVMISGKPLPSFPTFEFSPRAGGFIDGRFMTGIKPQEFFYHCMAGREGLIDTAVKTSRSGYLQRCLIKHLEGLHVAYDLTVRNSDKSVIQFLYGEDGMDISKVQFFNEKQLPFLHDNVKCIINKDVLNQLRNDEDQKKVQQYQENLLNWIAKNGPPLQKIKTSPFAYFCKELMNRSGKKMRKKLEKKWREVDDDFKRSIKNEITCHDPVNSVFQPDHYFGVLNERLEKMLNDHVQGQTKKQKKRFEEMFKLKTMQSMCAPGEPVGLLAAQSIGEPSTQMTLNTFHFAGRGEMNVTLGIPRLREILMMASRNIKTPSMEIPFKSVPNLELRAEELKKNLTRVVVANVLEKIDVTLKLILKPQRQHEYTLKFQFLPPQCYSREYQTSTKGILKHMKKKFFKDMFATIARVSKVKSNLVTMEQAPSSKFNTNDSDDSDVEGSKRGKHAKGKPVANDENSSDDDEVDDQEDAKLANKHQEQQEDQEAEEDEERKDAESDDEENEATIDDGIELKATMDQSVVDNYSFANAYNYNRKRHFCELTFSLPMSYKKLDLTAIMRDVAEKSVIWETSNIKRAITYMKGQEFMLRTDGINIGEMCKYHDLLDLNRLYCNDIHKMAETYGIEAASKIIVKEVKDVFNVYGIKVDPRHLSLIADYMTTTGTFQPMSRKGMENSSSPLQQMSFESSLQFLKAATIKGRQDDLENPSSSLMVGKPCSTGTGSFTVLQKIPSGSL